MNLARRLVVAPFLHFLHFQQLDRLQVCRVGDVGAAAGVGVQPVRRRLEHRQHPHRTRHRFGERLRAFPEPVHRARVHVLNRVPRGKHGEAFHNRVVRYGLQLLALLVGKVWGVEFEKRRRGCLPKVPGERFDPNLGTSTSVTSTASGQSQGEGGDQVLGRVLRHVVPAPRPVHHHFHLVPRSQTHVQSSLWKLNHVHRDAIHVLHLGALKSSRRRRRHRDDSCSSNGGGSGRWREGGSSLDREVPFVAGLAASFRKEHCVSKHDIQQRATAAQRLAVATRSRSRTCCAAFFLFPTAFRFWDLRSRFATDDSGC
mmetsp:Transcript_32062/g.65294  ORF Transcript_32062/g.65294 Transcript_32062/m.65294 type:complete len:314 (+) Transcript_32062:414-1355(+)